jgi:hypothetical protein
VKDEPGPDMKPVKHEDEVRLGARWRVTRPLPASDGQTHQVCSPCRQSEVQHETDEAPNPNATQPQVTMMIRGHGDERGW